MDSSAVVAMTFGEPDAASFAALIRDDPSLFKGDDFTRTDVTPARI